MATKIEISKSLDNWARNVVEKIRNRIVATDTIDSGELLRSIEYKRPAYSGNSKTWFVDFEMLDYGRYTDESNPRVKKSPKPPRNFFNKVIEDETDKLLDEIEDEIYLDIFKKLKK